MGKLKLHINLNNLLSKIKSYSFMVLLICLLQRCTVPNRYLIWLNPDKKLKSLKLYYSRKSYQGNKSNKHIPHLIEQLKYSRKFVCHHCNREFKLTIAILDSAEAIKKKKLNINHNEGVVKAELGSKGRLMFKYSSIDIEGTVKILEWTSRKIIIRENITSAEQNFKGKKVFKIETN